MIARRRRRWLLPLVASLLLACRRWFGGHPESPAAYSTVAVSRNGAGDSAPAAIHSATAPVVSVGRPSSAPSAFTTWYARDAIFEAEWLAEIFPRKIAWAPWASDEDAIARARATGTPPVFVICCQNPPDSQTSRTIRAVSAAGVRFGVVHLSDEWERDDVSWYPLAAWVVRQYFRASLADAPHLIVIPLGWRPGLWDGVPAGERAARRALGDRPLVWAFAGDSDKSESRRGAMAALRPLQPHAIHDTEGWLGARTMPAAAYRAFLANASFVPCPAGNWNHDTFRVSEALEAGAVPVVVRTAPHQAFDYWAAMLGPNHRLVVADTWGEAAAEVAALAADPAALAARRAETLAWWAETKAALRRRWESELDS